jgi:hypothetical protein
MAANCTSMLLQRTANSIEASTHLAVLLDETHPADLCITPSPCFCRVPQLSRRTSPKSQGPRCWEGRGPARATPSLNYKLVVKSIVLVMIRG